MGTSSEFAQRERIPTRVFADADEACLVVADAIESLIRGRADEGRMAVLGLATGSTPVRLYRELIRRHEAEGLSFANVVTFNLDEYYGLVRDHPESYHRFMREQLFDHVDIALENTHVPDGTVERDAVFEACRDYERRIEAAGGIDIQVLGIGRTGHIGFNEPGSGSGSRTRLVTLDRLTRRDAARDFLGEENVPRHAITMGVGTILDARRVFLLAWGEAKAEVLAQAVEEPPTGAVPASFLQEHKDCTFCIDVSAARDLTRFSLPWLVGPVDWDSETTRKAVLWLARETEKPLLKLVDEDYAEHGMGELLTEYGSAYQLNIHIFNVTQHTITGWPGGKPDADDSNRPERALPYPKRSLVLSPEPMDDVYCLGGTLNRLVRHGHDVTVAYQTSGDLAVPDTDFQRAIELLRELEGEDAETVLGRSIHGLAVGAEAQAVPEENRVGSRSIKALIRRGEARAAARLLKVDVNRLRFLDLPFYENGSYRRFRVTETDIATMTDLLRELRPDQIFATGFGHDPLSVPALCFSVLESALGQCRDDAWLSECRIWLYQGPGAEWNAHEIDMAVPLSPDEFADKLQGIYQHQTQRSQSPTLRTAGSGDTWNLASRINRETAEIYDALGLAEYAAIECFKRRTRF